MTAKEYLSQAYRLDKRIERKIEDRDRMRSRLVKATAQLTGMPKGGNADWTDAAVHVMEYEEQLNREIVELCKLKREIRETIDAVEEKRYRDLLEMRYLNGMRWEKIAVEMNYSYEHIRHLHGRALQAVKVPKQVNTQ